MLASRLHAPLQALNQVAQRLVEGGVLVEVADAEGGMQPARPPESITIADVLHVVRTNDGTGFVEPGRAGSEPIEQTLSEIAAVVRSASANANFGNLVTKLD